MDMTIGRARALRGEVTVPGDKSISHRAVMIGGLAHGDTEISGFLRAADPLSTLACFKALGIPHTEEADRLIVHGKGIRGLQQPTAILDAGNSGTTMRLISGILAGQPFPTEITGDQYLVKRPMKRILDPLRSMGADIEATEKGTAPLRIHPVGKLRAIDYRLPIASAQVKSAVLLAGMYADGITRVIESEPSRDHTERMLGLSTEKNGGETIVSITGGKELIARPFAVPGDPSSAAFFAVAASIVPGSRVIIRNVGLNPTRTGFLTILRSMGAAITVENERNVGGEPIGDLVVEATALRSNITVSGEIIPNVIDELPILSVAAAFAEGTFEVRGAQDLRNKETDRIAAVCANLRRMGLTVDEYQDGFAFESKKDVLSSDFDSEDDHRIAMAFGVAALALPKESTIRHAECVAISFPPFWDMLRSLQG